MKNIWRNCITLLAVLFVSANFVFAYDYTDLDKNHWAYNFVQFLTDEGVAVGYPDGSFHPNEYVTRAEFASMAIKGLKMQDYQVKEIIDFDDIPLDHWAYDQIQRAAYFDLIDAKDKTFDPEGTVTRGHAISVVVNALTTENITEEKARDILKASYLDYYTIKPEYIVVAGKAKLLGLDVDAPNTNQVLAADQPATRAELCAFLFKMIEAAKLNPNKKIADAMPKIAQGIVIDATVEGNVATIPAGALIPITIVEPMSSQKSVAGQLFLAKTTDNLVTKENFLLFKKDDPIAGRILDVKKAKLFVQNGALNLETKTLKTHNDQLVSFPTIADVHTEYYGFWKKFCNMIFKNAKVNLNEDDSISIKLIKPIKVDVGNGWVIEQ